MLLIRNKFLQLFVAAFLLIFTLASARPAVAADVASAPAAAVTCDTHGDESLGMSSLVYDIKEGDTLYAIGQACEVDWHRIAAANGLTTPYTIYAGQPLIIPVVITGDGGTGGPGTGGLATYVVQPGDWLWKIGRTLSINPLEIARVNGITAPYVIYPGQVLVLP